MGFLSSGVFAGVFVLLYAEMTGAGISTQRASIMFLLSVSAAAAGQAYDLLNGLGISILWMLWENPSLYQYSGFVFSVTAILGIGLTVRILSEKDAGKWKAAFRSGIGIQITTMPVAAYYYYELPSYAILLNLLVIPSLPVVLISGALGGVIGSVWPEAGKIAILPAGLVLKGYLFLCNLAADLPFSEIIVGKPSEWKLAIYYFLLFVILYFGWKRKQYKKKLGAYVWMGLFGLLAILYHRIPLGVELDMLDVGQGDGIFFSDGDGNYFFIDGGSTNVGNVGTYRILPFLKSKGIAGIGYWFVSHGDADHISGLQEVLESGYPVENLVLAKAMPHDSAYMTLIGIAQEHGTQIRYLDEGDSLGTDQTEFICLYPDYREESGNAGAETTDNMWGDTESADTESADRNALSLVLLLKTEYFSCLFPGDITEAEETKLLADGAFTQVDIYKAAHHGSKYSNSRKYLEKLSPMYALISCSSTNGYGHPGEEAVANMEASGAAVYYTMKQGEITIRPQKNGIEVIPFVGYNVRRQ